MEKWRPIPGLEDFYEASSAGRIRSVERMVRTKGGALRVSRAKVLSATQNTRYSFVKISVDGVVRTGLVHRLVCSAFHGAPRTPDLQAAHIDGNPKNNAAPNLRWSTARENCADRERHGRWVHGTRVNTNKLTEADVRTILAKCAAGAEPKKVAEEYGVHRSSVHQMLRGDTWKHLTR